MYTIRNVKTGEGLCTFDLSPEYVLSIDAPPVLSMPSTRHGRPPLTPERIPASTRLMLRAYDPDCMTIAHIARCCGCSRPTVYKYMRMLGIRPR